MSFELFFCLSDLQKRGWTPKWISTHLGEPDELKTNPHYKRAAPMRLYSAERVEQAEQISEVAEHLARTLERRGIKAATEAAQAEVRSQERKARWQAHEGAIAKKYPDGWRQALADACEALYELNHFAKITNRATKKEIYSVKNDVIKLLYVSGHCTQCYLHTMRGADRPCWGCNGTGFKMWSDKECYRCGGTGIFQKGETLKLVCFHFVVNDQNYCWHQPSDKVHFPYQTTKPSEAWNDDLQDVEYGELEWEEVRSHINLLKWIIKSAKAEAKRQSPATGKVVSITSGRVADVTLTRSENLLTAQSGNLSKAQRKALRNQELREIVHTAKERLIKRRQRQAKAACN